MQYQKSPKGILMNGAIATKTLLVLVLLMCAFLTAFRIVPIPADTDAMTLCFPITGPVQRFRKDIEPEYLPLIQAHEAVHAEQCRRMGAIDYFTNSQNAHGRISSEAEAYCAELRLQVGQGYDAGQLVNGMVDAMRMGYGTEGGVSVAEIRVLLAAYCGELVPET